MEKRIFPLTRRDFLRGVFAGTTVLALGMLAENRKAGAATWSLTDPAHKREREIEGYASLTSVNRGGTIQFFVNTIDSKYTINIYRMGWYNGAGGRLVHGPITDVIGTRQIIPTPDPETGLIECQWINPYTLSIPSPTKDPTNNWCSGIYLAQLTGQTSGLQAYIMFVVRDDDRPSDILFQSSVNTFQAYNKWGGKTLYDYNSTDQHRANRVSFNRPYARLTADRPLGAGTGAAEFILGSENGPPGGWEFCTLRFLEREGYDVTYCTDVDTHENPSLLLSHNTYLSVGHDEYWSQEMRDNVTNARDQGVKLGFLGANACYWQVRFESSPINRQANRTIVCYKGANGINNVRSHDPLYGLGGDPANDNQISVRWRESLPSSSRVARPEESLVGTMYDFGADSVSGDIIITDPSNWIFNNTNMVDGSRLTGLLGYECDRIQRGGPPDAIQLAHTAYTSGNSINSNGAGAYDMALYTAASGATVWSVGTIQWAWGLDDWGALPDLDGNPGLRPSFLNAAAQQMTRNFLARPNDVPIVKPGGPYFAAANTPIQMNASASFDNHAAITSYAWDFGDGLGLGSAGTGATPTHTYPTAGKYTVTLTLTNSAGTTNTATTTATIGLPLTIWDDSAVPYMQSTNYASPIEVGVRFRSDVPGTIIGVRFYKGPGNTGAHTGSLWTNSGILLTTATFGNETETGWQTVAFNSPVTIQANVTYVASYHTSTGFYSSDDYYFAFQGYDNAPLHALKDGANGSSGVYLYGTGGFPTNSFHSANYWVDVVLVPTGGVIPPTIPIVTNVTPAVNSAGASVSTTLTATFSKAMDATTITNSTIVLRDSTNNVVPATVTYNAASNTAVLSPTSQLALSTTYSAEVVGGSHGVKDIDGNALATNFTWSFTTDNTTDISIWNNSSVPAIVADGDSSAVELGVRFRSDVSGTIVGIRFYKGPGNTGTHTGSLWTNTGALLATATFNGETAGGWQQVDFSTPVPIQANTTYLASYHTSTGHYSTDNAYFANAGFDNAPLHALMDGLDGSNGNYLYGAGGFPANSYRSANYWVDVTFAAGP